MTANSEGESSAGDPPVTRDDLADPLEPWARFLALALGLGASGFGCYAVLVSENQAGTALILLTGAVLLLLGLQGTPLRRLGSGEHSLELAALRRKQRAIEVIAEVTREQPPEIAAAVIEAVDAIEPHSRDPRLRAMRYEAMVKEAIERVGGQVPSASGSSGPDFGFDLFARVPAGEVVVEVRHRSARPLSLYDVMDANRRVSADVDGGLVLVTNSIVSARIQQYNDENASDPTQFEVVRWNGRADDDQLARTLARKAR